MFTELVEKLSNHLEAQDIMLATAESCTGGMIAAAMTERAGSSAVFERGFVTYSNEAKIEALGVDETIIAQYGAVSPKTALAMALGVLDYSRADLAVSVTGIAGPSGGSEAKPVGLVYIGVAKKGGVSEAFEHHFEGDRTTVRKQTVSAALTHLIDLLEAKAE